MKIKRICAVASAISLLAVMAMGNSISAEEVSTEAFTDVNNTQLSTGTSVSDESITATEETTVAVKSIIVAEISVFDEWTGEDFSKTVELGAFGYDFGEFAGLMLNDTVIDSSNYTVSQNGNESITFTISEAFMSTLVKDTNYFTVDFEKVTIQPAFAVNISEAEENTTEESTTVVSYNKTESPKTGDISSADIFFYDSLTYVIRNDEITITGCSDTEIIIPEEIDGYPITTLGYGMMFYNPYYTSITLPETLKVIEHEAIVGCVNIKEITIPKSVESIGEKALGYDAVIENGNLWLDFKLEYFVIKGYKGTAAETYANENGFTFIALDESEVTTTVTTSTSTTTETTVSTTATTSIETTTNTEITTTPTVTTAITTTSAVSNTTAEQTTTTETTSIITTATTTTTKPIKIKGDANGDNKLDVRDCAFIASALANSIADDLTEISDFNSDGKINVRDAAAIATHLASK